MNVSARPVMVSMGKPTPSAELFPVLERMP
jgi:hypothetical protein